MGVAHLLGPGAFPVLGQDPASLLTKGPGWVLGGFLPAGGRLPRSGGERVLWEWASLPPPGFSPPQDLSLKLCLIQSVCMVCQAICNSAQSGDFTFSHKAELVAQMMVRPLLAPSTPELLPEAGSLASLPGPRKSATLDAPPGEEGLPLRLDPRTCLSSALSGGGGGVCEGDS